MPKKYGLYEAKVCHLHKKSCHLCNDSAQVHFIFARKFNSLTKGNALTKKGIMAEEKNRMKVWPIKKDCVSLHKNQVCPDVFGILKTKQRASFSYNGNLRKSTYKNGECRTVVSVPSGADFCHIPFLRFLRTSIGRI